MSYKQFYISDTTPVPSPLSQGPQLRIRKDPCSSVCFAHSAYLTTVTPCVDNRRQRTISYLHFENGEIEPVRLFCPKTWRSQGPDLAYLASKVVSLTTGKHIPSDHSSPAFSSWLSVGDDFHFSDQEPRLNHSPRDTLCNLTSDSQKQIQQTHPLHYQSVTDPSKPDPSQPNARIRVRLTVWKRPLASLAAPGHESSANPPLTFFSGWSSVGRAPATHHSIWATNQHYP